VQAGIKGGENQGQGKTKGWRKLENQGINNSKGLKRARDWKT
jgi:hypothetical protein